MKVYGLDKNKNKLEYDVIMTFKGSQDFVLYTDNSVDKNNNLIIYSAVYDPKTGLIVREPNSKKELKEIEEAFNSSIVNK